MAGNRADAPRRRTPTDATDRAGLLKVAGHAQAIYMARGRQRGAAMFEAAPLLPLAVKTLGRMPVVRIDLSDQPAGREIHAWIAPKKRRFAQTVLQLPTTLDDYLRGRSRQAVRTNVRHATKAGMSVRRYPDGDPAWPLGVTHLVEAGVEQDGWLPLVSTQPRELRAAVTDASGDFVALAAVTVDRSVAMLRTHVAVPVRAVGLPARYLLHTFVVEELIARGVETLLVEQGSAILMSENLHYFSGLLGYTMAHLRFA